MVRFPSCRQQRPLKSWRKKVAALEESVAVHESRHMPPGGAGQGTRPANAAQQRSSQRSHHGAGAVHSTSVPEFTGMTWVPPVKRRTWSRFSHAEWIPPWERRQQSPAAPTPVSLPTPEAASRRKDSKAGTCAQKAEVLS